MLARNAESLYWIGRYVERADDTARILDVSVHQLLEDATVDADVAARTLLGVLGVEPPEDDALDAWSLTELVGYSAEQPGSIVSSVSSARENARGAREVVSSEMWEWLNVTWNALPERQRYARWVGPHAFFSYVEDRAAMFSGLAASTMSRDDTWRSTCSAGRWSASTWSCGCCCRGSPTGCRAPAGSPCCAVPVPPTPTCAPTAARSTPAGSCSSCSWTGCSRVRCSTRCARPSCASPSWTTGRPRGSAPRPRRCGCSAGPARSSSSSGRRSCSTISLLS